MKERIVGKLILIRCLSCYELVIQHASVEIRVSFVHSFNFSLKICIVHSIQFTLPYKLLAKLFVDCNFH